MTKPTYGIAAGLLVVATLSCGDKAQPAADGDAKAKASTKAEQPDAKPAAGLGELAGSRDRPSAKIRWVNAHAPAGAKQGIAVHARTTTVLESLAWGEVSPYVDVPVSTAGSETALWVTKAGEPKGNDGKILPRLEADKSYTIVVYDGFKRLDPQPADVADVLAHVAMDEASPRNKAASPKAALWVATDVIQSVRLPMKWGIVGRGCLPHGDIHQVEPGSVEVALYDLSPENSACAGTPLAKASAVAFTAGKTHVAIPIGETKEELAVKVLPVE